MFGPDGLPLPALNDDFATETEGIDPETIVAYGERLRLEHIEETAAQQIAVLKARQASNVVRLEPRPLPKSASTPQAKLSPEPRRVAWPSPAAMELAAKQVGTSEFVSLPAKAAAAETCHGKAGCWRQTLGRPGILAEWGGR
jgi:hypothetical protein